MHDVTVTHNFETAHRLPGLPGKCQSLHGHSWWCHVTVSGPELAAGTIVEFGAFKRSLRDWIDTHLDHGSMLGPADPLIPLLRAEGCKVHEVEGWPTVENVAAMLAGIAAAELDKLVRAPGCAVTSVRVTETHVNEAAWRP